MFTLRLFALHNRYVSGCRETLPLLGEVSKVDDALESFWIFQLQAHTQNT